MVGGIDEVVVDCTDPGALAAFWAQVLGGEPVERDEAWWYVLPPGWTQLSCQRVPEGKTVKNRLHLDVLVEDITAATVAAQAVGARLVGEVQHGGAGSSRSWPTSRATSGAWWCRREYRAAVDPQQRARRC